MKGQQMFIIHSLGRISIERKGHLWHLPWNAFPSAGLLSVCYGRQLSLTLLQVFLWLSQLAGCQVLAAVELFDSRWFGAQASVTSFLHQEGRAGLWLIRCTIWHHWKLSLKPLSPWMFWCCAVYCVNFSDVASLNDTGLRQFFGLGLHRTCNKNILQLLYLIIVLKKCVEILCV